MAASIAASAPPPARRPTTTTISPREIVQLLWTENLEGIYDAMQEKIWACAQCYTCAARCPFGNSPGGLVMIMREVAIKHGMESARTCCGRSAA